MRLELTVYGEAQPAGSKTTDIVRRKGGAIVMRDDGRPLQRTRDDNPKAKPWKEAVAREAGLIMQGRTLMAGGIECSAIFYRVRPKGHYGARGNLLPSAPDYPTTKPDRGKLLRAVEDALTGIVWRDDAQVCTGAVTKLYGEPARVELVITEMPPLRARAVPAVTGSLFETAGGR